MTEKKGDKQLDEGVENLKQNYINHIFEYLTKGVFKMPDAGKTYMKAYE